MLTTILELLCVSLVSLFLFAVWPPAALLPTAVLSGLVAWDRRR